MSRRARHRRHIAALRRDGAQLAAYTCPGCDRAIAALVPAPGDRYDTAVVCPDCARMHFRVVRDDGSMAAEPLPAANHVTTPY